MGAAALPSGTEIEIDPFRALVFPNGIREQRRRAGMESLLTLAGALPHIPYIRLSKLERGEVVAKASELVDIAAVLEIEPLALLTDVEAADFNIASWAGLRGEPVPINREGEELAMLLAAAFRGRRALDPSLTLARLNGEFGLPAVIVSRIENAVKSPDRWNAATMESICRVLEAKSPRDLYDMLRAAYADGHLSPYLARIPGAADRMARTKAAIAKLRSDLAHPPVTRRRPAATARGMTGGPGAHVAETRAAILHPHGEQMATPALTRLAVRGVPAADGCIDPRMEEGEVTAPSRVGPRAYALRMGRPTLGAAIPGHAVLIVDPDRFPANSGLAVLTEGELRRVVSVTIDREGRMTGYSANPEKEIPLDTIAPSEIAMVTAVLLG